jgi:hypothetical protein
MLVKTKKLNKQRNKHLNKYTSTKKKVSRRTRKNDLVLRGGGEDGEYFRAFYENSILKKNIYAKTTESSLNKLNYLRCQELPKIELKKNGKYKIRISIKSLDVPNQQTQSTQKEQYIGHIIMKRAGILFHSQTPDNSLDEKYKTHIKTLANENKKINFMLILKIYKISTTKNKNTENQNASETLYIKLEPIA